jgi:hypothetical protein
MKITGTVAFGCASFALLLPSTKILPMDFFLFEQREEMPRELHDAEGKLFDACKQCGKNLLEPPASYTLEKVFKRYPNTESPQILFEYAVCDDCAGEMRDEFSEESAANIQNYFAKHMANLDDLEERDLDARLHTCMIKNSSLADEQEYAVVARGHGNKMLLSHYPFAIGLTAMDEISELISEKTRDLLDDFVDRNFIGPPEFENSPVDGKWVLV